MAEAAPDAGVARMYLEVSQSPAGRVMIADLENKFACNPFCPGDPHQTSHNCGCLRVLQEIAEQIRRAITEEQPRQETAIV